MIDAKDNRESYDLIAEKYADVRDQQSSAPFLRLLSEKLTANSQILDLGCGTGLPTARWFIDEGHRVTGLDISPAMLALARMNVPEAEFQLADFSSLKARQFSVDAVVSIFALFHVDHNLHEGILKTIRTFLKDGSFMLISTGKVDWEGNEDFLGTTMSWSHFDATTYRKMIEKCGFEIVLEDEHRGSDGIDHDAHPIFLAQAI